MLLFGVSFNFLPKGEQNKIVWIIGGGGERDKYVFVCKASAKLWGFGGMFPRKILIFDLLLDAIWWNLDTNNLAIIKGFIIESQHIKVAASQSQGGAFPPLPLPP